MAKLTKAVTIFMGNQLEIQIPVKAARKLGEKAWLIELGIAENEKETLGHIKQKLRNIKDDRIFINHDKLERERE